MTQSLSCDGCGKSQNLCVCKWLNPVSTDTHVLFLQHPQEQHKELSTALLAHRCLPNSTIKVGLSWPNLHAALGRQADPRRWIVFYLGSASLKRKIPKGDAPFYLVRRKGTLVPPEPELIQSLDGIVLLDGNWRQAKTLWWRNPWLLKLQRGILRPEQRSRYRQLRREPRDDSVSTIEAVALALSRLERRPEVQSTLLLPFDKLLEQFSTGSES